MIPITIKELNKLGFKRRGGRSFSDVFYHDSFPQSYFLMTKPYTFEGLFASMCEAIRYNAIETGKALKAEELRQALGIKDNDE